MDEAGYLVRTGLIETDARGVFGMLQRLRYDDILEKKGIRKEVRKVLVSVRKAVRDAAKGAMRSDPRKAYLGVKMMIYRRKATGGNVSLLSSKSRGKQTPYVKPKGGVSGKIRNRPKHRRTVELESYHGVDRAFILRFLNQGTKQRTAFTKYATSKNNRTANRGSISAKNFFNVADSNMNAAAQTLSKRIEQLIVEAGYGK